MGRIILELTRLDVYERIINLKEMRNRMDSGPDRDNLGFSEK